MKRILFCLIFLILACSLASAITVDDVKPDEQVGDIILMTSADFPMGDKFYVYSFHYERIRGEDIVVELYEYDTEAKEDFEKKSYPPMDCNMIDFEGQIIRRCTEGGVYYYEFYYKNFIFWIGTKNEEDVQKLATHIILKFEPCTENWQCAEWSNCINNEQTRTCTDQNNCGTTNSKPVESQSCTLCGNSVVDAGETCSNCPSDVSCGELYCLNDVCVECIQSSDCVGKERLTGEFVCSADNKGVHEKILETSGDCADNKCTGSVEKLGPVKSCEGKFCQDGRCGCSEEYSGCEALGKCVKMNALDVNDVCRCDFQCKSGYCRDSKCMQGLVANFKSADTILKPGEETSVSFSISNPFDEEVFADVVVGIGSGSSISGVLGGEYCSGSQCKTTVRLPGNGQGDITLQVQGNDIGTINLQSTVTYTREGKESEISKELTVKVTKTGKEETAEEIAEQKEKTGGYQATSKLGKIYQSSKIFRKLIWPVLIAFIVISYFIFRKKE